MKDKPRLKSRPVTIKLNTAYQQLALRICLLFAPLVLYAPILIFILFTGLMLKPLIIISALTLITMLFPITALALAGNKLEFKENCLVYPGFWFTVKSVDYGAIKSVDMSGHKLLLETAGNKISVDLSGISREGAADLWKMFSSKLRSAKIHPDVRSLLKDWNKADDEMLSSIDEKLADKDDLRILINLKQRVRISSSAENTEFKFWIAWYGCAVAMATMVLVWMAVEYFHPLGQPNEDLLSTVSNMLLPILFVVQSLFGNFLGVILLAWLIGYISYKTIKDWTEADSVFIDSLGLTTQVRTPAGTMPQEHLSWNSIKSIELIDEGKRDWEAVLITPSIERPPILIPVRCLSSQKIRSNFLEALDAWARRIKVDPRLSEVLTPQPDLSAFTQLWLSSMESAPNLNDLTPLHREDLSKQGFSIERPLGSGGQGMTYLANGKEGKTVLKETVLPVYMEAARKKEEAQFVREAAMLKELDHPGIVKLHDYFVVGNRAYLALEYLEGESLKERIERCGALDEETVRSLAGQMASILIYLHDRTPPVVHRDFTPDNLIIDSEGRLKLIDFGVALKSEGEHSTVSRAVGKQNYVPPEQFRGKPSQQSDIYSLGATLYFLCTALLPEPLTTSSVKEGISEELSSIIGKATALDLADRYQNAKALLEDLQKPYTEAIPKLPDLKEIKESENSQDLEMIEQAQVPPAKIKLVVVDDGGE